MLFSQKRLRELEERISALEEKEQERKRKEDYVKEHSAEGLALAKRLLPLGRN